MTTSPPKPDENDTAPPSVPVPTTAAPEPPLVNVTAQPPMANVTIPPVVRTTPNSLNEDNVIEAPRAGIVLILQKQLYTPGVGTSIIFFFLSKSSFCDFQNF